MDPRLIAAFAHRYPGGTEVEARLDLPLDRPTTTVLFGPSGSGKSTVLRVLAGLERPHRGRITCGADTWLDTEAGRHLPPWRRSVGLLFQDYALFPHLSAAENLAYGLRGGSRARVGPLMERLGLAGLGDRRPDQLSGGQQQRVALGRALLRAQDQGPGLLLLDEPLSALDRPTQENLRRQLRGWLREAGLPVVLVTHDRTEALTLGDRVCLMADGRIRQEGTPAEVFSRPADPELARLLGLGTVVKVRVLEREHGLVRVAAGAAELWAPDPGGLETHAYACIRAEGVVLERGSAPAGSARNHLAGRLTTLEPQGALVRLELDCGFPLEALATAWACEDLALAPGTALTAAVKATAIHLIPID